MRTGASDGGPSGSLSDPPRFKIESKLEYREDMESWIEVVAQRATVDRHYKGICSSLALLVIQSLPKSQQELVNSAVARGEIIKKHPSFQMQLRAVQQIVALIAVDTPTEVVGRISQAFREVSTCQRGKNESLKKFAVRFQGLAEVYLRISGATESDPAGMMLALTFLENANLKPETRTQIQLQLSKGGEMDGVPLSERTFICDNHAEIDQWMDNHNMRGDSDAENEILLSEGSRVIKEGAQSRMIQDKKFFVPDNLFDQTAKSPLPAMTISEIYVVMNRMPDLTEKSEDYVSSKQLKTLMASWKPADNAAGASKPAGKEPGRRGSGPPGGQSGQKRASAQREREDYDSRCFRCLSADHLYRDCPMREATCSHCNRQGHEEWLCFDKHEMTGASLSEKKSWRSERIQERYGRNGTGQSGRKDDREKRARVDDGSDKASAVFRQRRQG